MVAVVDPSEIAVVPPNTADKLPGRSDGAGDSVISRPPPVRSASHDEEAGSPVSIAASIRPADQRSPGGLLLPCDRHIGAAAFRRGNSLVMVFDSSKPIDLSPIGDDPTFGATSYVLLSSGAMLTLPLRAGVDVDVSRRPEGWLIGLAAPARSGSPIVPDKRTNEIVLPVRDPGHVVVISDLISGADLLIGTVKADGQNTQLRRRDPSHVLYPTLLGVVVERLSDRLEMRAGSNGFVLEEPIGKNRPPVGLATSKGLFFSRSLDLPAVSDAELERRYKAALATAATLSTPERRLPRLDAAEAALALGQSREAGQLAAIADQDAPAGPQAARSIFLQAAAAVIDGSPMALALLEDPRIANSDEVTMWRALDLAHRDPANADAARTIAHDLPMLTNYPSHLRRRLLGDAAMSLATAGGPGVVAQLQDLHGDGKVRLAQTMLPPPDRQATAALAMLDQLAADDDPAVRFGAATRAVEIRSSLGQLKPRQAADRLEAETVDARRAGKEASLRLGSAGRRAQAGDWAAALQAVRDVKASFPDAAEQAERTSVDILKRMAANGMSVGGPPDVGQLSMIEGNLDLLPAGADRTRVSIGLAHRFAELDLPDRAAVLLSGDLAQTGPGLERARLGLELARLRMEHADASGTLAALDVTVTTDLPADLSDARAFMRARADAASGHADAALAILAPRQGADVDELRAAAFASKQDWHGQAAALASLMTREVPATRPLVPAGEDLVLRVASAIARSGDQDALRQLALHWSDRFTTPAKRDMLRLLTSDGVRGDADLSRSAAELSVSRSALSALSAVPAKAGG